MACIVIAGSLALLSMSVLHPNCLEVKVGPDASDIAKNVGRRAVLTEWWLPLIAAPLIGSFLGVLIRRLPVEAPVGWSRSRCECCHTNLAPRDLVPIASFLALRGRCRFCAAPIGRFHLAVELAAMLVPIWVLSVSDDPGLIWANCALGWALLALAWIDWESFLLPDVITLPLVLAGLGVTWWQAPWSLLDHLIGTVAGFASLSLVALVYRRLRKRDGLGEGDARLLAAAGAWVGWQPLADLLLGAAIAGIVIALLRGLRNPTAMLPFGPCLAAALWLIRLYWPDNFGG